MDNPPNGNINARLINMANIMQFGDWSKIDKPTGFTWDAPINLYRSKSGKIGTDFDVSNYEYVGAGKKYYVDIINGSDSNDGSRLSKAFKTLKKAAITAGDADIIYVASGEYDISNAFISETVTRSMSIKALPNNKVNICAVNILTWALSSGQTYTYEATCANAYNLYDAKYLTADGDYTGYILKASIAEVEATAGSYYISGTTVYVHTSDNRIPDVNIKVYRDVKNFYTEGNITIYCESINFHGGTEPVQIKNINTGHRPKFYAKNCKFKYGKSSGGLRIEGCQYSFTQNCETALNGDDGFGYHTTLDVVPKIIEVNCIGRDNGTTSDTDNGSTTHGGISAVRVNGMYYRNKGPNVADVQSSQAWILGCTAFGSKTISSNAQNTDFQVSDTTEASESWLDTCVGYGSYSGISSNYSGAIAHIKNCTFSSQYTQNGATIVSY